MSESVQPDGDAISEALQEKGDKGEPVGRPPWGLTTDKKRFGLDDATRFVPVEGEEDKVRTAVDICNEIAFYDVDVNDTGQDPTPHTIGRRNGIDNSPTVRVRLIWKRREDYREVAEQHLEDVSIYWDK